MLVEVLLLVDAVPSQVSSLEILADPTELALAGWLPVDGATATVLEFAPDT